MKKLTPYSLVFLLAALWLLGTRYSSAQTMVTGTIRASGSSCTMPDASGGATYTGSTNCVVVRLASTASQASVVLAGTFSATVQFELSADNGATWVAAPTASSTSAGTSNFQVAAYTHLRARASSYSSGAVTTTITVSTAAISGGGGGSVTFAGDLSGTPSTQTVTGINNTLLSGLPSGFLQNTTSTGVPVVTPLPTPYPENMILWQPSTLSSQACATNTIVVQGARANQDAVAPIWPSALPAGVAPSMRVTAPDQIEIRLCNPTAGSVTWSASLLWGAKLIR